MVRLKAENSSQSVEDPSFQFLMVRLKAYVDKLYRFSWFVSIPYGTIKSARCVTSTQTPTKFQFLMVRLKDDHTPRFADFGLVSIPYT